MKAVIQRVKHASVTIDGNLYSKIGHGLLVLFCVEKGDTNQELEWMCKKIPALRIFEDENGKMNKSLLDTGGEILAVSQFTLAGNCKKGTRPSFDNAAEPAFAKQMYEKFCTELAAGGISVKTGVFAAMMDVGLCNDGPVTIILEKNSEKGLA